MTRETAVLRLPQDLSVDWLREALGTGPIADFTVEPIGTGQMSESRRVVIDYATGGGGPEIVVLKTASDRRGQPRHRRGARYLRSGGPLLP